MIKNPSLVKAVAGATLIKKDKDQKSQCSTEISFDDILRKKIKKLKKVLTNKRKNDILISEREVRNMVKTYKGIRYGFCKNAKRKYHKAVRKAGKVACYEV